jgi:hypothetical protein
MVECLEFTHTWFRFDAQVPVQHHMPAKNISHQPSCPLDDHVMWFKPTIILDTYVRPL